MAYDEDDSDDVSEQHHAQVLAAKSKDADRHAKDKKGRRHTKKEALHVACDTDRAGRGGQEHLYQGQVAPDGQVRVTPGVGAQDVHGRAAIRDPQTRAGAAGAPGHLRLQARD